MTAQLSIVRHEPIFDPNQFDYLPIHIVGAGATGSRVFMSLVELGINNITVWDFDTVEAHNLANQAFTHQHIGQPKVQALECLYRSKVGVPNTPDTMHFKNERVTNQQLDGIVFLLTDSMASRREIMSRQDTSQILRVFETRMASTHGNVFSFNPRTELDEWLSTLISDDAAEVSPCGSPISVGPTTSIIANLAVWQFMSFLLDDGCASAQVDCFFKPTIITTKDSLHG